MFFFVLNANFWNVTWQFYVCQRDDETLHIHIVSWLKLLNKHKQIEHI